MNRLGGVMIGAGLLLALQQLARDYPAKGILAIGVLLFVFGMLAWWEAHEREIDERPPKIGSVEWRDAGDLATRLIIVRDTEGNRLATFELRDTDLRDLPRGVTDLRIERQRRRDS